jgi:hypothetical protein
VRKPVAFQLAKSRHGCMAHLFDATEPAAIDGGITAVLGSRLHSVSKKLLTGDCCR